MLLYLALLVVSAECFCTNSPKSVPELHGILKKALVDLQLQLYVPNLRNSGPDACNISAGSVKYCGFPFFFSGSNTLGVVGYPNPDFNYTSPVVNSSKLLFTNRNDPGTYTDVSVQLKKDEAVIWFGCTPNTTYFSFSKFVLSAGPFTPQNKTNLRLGTIGDSLNNFNFKVWANDPNNRKEAATLVIYTAAKEAAHAITKAFVLAGFPESAINVQNLPDSVSPLGQDDHGSFIQWAVRLTSFNAAEKAAIQDWSQVQLQFPFVRLTRFVSHPPPTPISSALEWTPDYLSDHWVDTMKQSEFTYEPVVMNVVSSLVTNLKQVLPTHFTLPNNQSYNVSWKIYPVRPHRLEDDGTKWSFEKQYGLELSRDCSYYAFNPVVAPSLDTTLGLNFTIAVGLHHESQAWTVANPLVPQLFPSSKPHAIYWSMVWYNSSAVNVFHTNLADAGLQSVSSLHWAVAPAPADPLNVIWLRAVGNPGYGCSTVAKALGLNCLSPGAKGSNVPNLQTWYRTYVNPQTGVYPSPITILPPFLIHVVGVPTHV